MYAEPVDGWSCHLFSVCRSAERGPDDPRPSWRSEYAFDGALMECRLGEYYKLREPALGWVLARDIGSCRLD